ncbi:MAG: transporter substrate-binding domain-containing protein [Flavobacterium sp.]
MNFIYKKSLFCFALVSLFFLISTVGIAQTAIDSIGKSSPTKLRVGYAGSEPFVIHNSETWKGISIEIWEKVADAEKINYEIQHFNSVSTAIRALTMGEIDAVVGPASITSARAEKVEFSQPYYQASLSILSRVDDPNLLDRIAPFFTISLLYALLVFLFILAIVGTLLWLSERKSSPEQFPHDAPRGIANGMWCAIVTMSTTGYGDIAPVTLMGRIIAGAWMIISFIFATSMIAGIASTLTLSGLGTVQVSSAEQFINKKIAVLKDSPSAEFVTENKGKNVTITNLKEGYDLLKNKEVDAVVFDRPQMMYYLEQNPDKHMIISVAEYLKQGYGFAFPLNSQMVFPLNIQLLKLKEDGSLKTISENYLGTPAQE